MKKHIVECPHCCNKFEFVPPKKIKQQSVMHDIVYTECVRYWLKELHPGWTFEGVQGKSLKALLKKIKKTIEDRKKLVYSDQVHIDSFVYLCQNLPEFFKDKDLQKINSAYNEIIEQMKNGKTDGKPTKWHSKTSAERYSEVNGRFKD